MESSASQSFLFTGTAHPALAKEVADCLGTRLGKVAIERFPDGEISLQIQENVRGKDVFVFQTVAFDPSRYLMELLIFIDALKREAPRSIVAVIPYFGYCRKDRKDRQGEPITAKLVANLIETAGTTRVVTMDLHADQVQGFFDIPVDDIVCRQVLIEEVKQLCGNDIVVVTPDMGSAKLGSAYARLLDCGLALIDKQRISACEVDAVNFIGDVKGKDVLLADDMCSTAGTLTSAAKACQEKGAKRIFAVVTHGILVGQAIERIEKSPIEALVISNTVPVAESVKQCSKVRIVSIAPLLARAINCLIS